MTFGPERTQAPDGLIYCAGCEILTAPGSLCDLCQRELRGDPVYLWHFVSYPVIEPASTETKRQRVGTTTERGPSKRPSIRHASVTSSPEFRRSARAYTRGI